MGGWNSFCTKRPFHRSGPNEDTIHNSLPGILLSLGKQPWQKGWGLTWSTRIHWWNCSLLWRLMASESLVSSLNSRTKEALTLYSVTRISSKFRLIFPSLHFFIVPNRTAFNFLKPFCCYVVIYLEGVKDDNPWVFITSLSQPLRVSSLSRLQDWEHRNGTCLSSLETKVNLF